MNLRRSIRRPLPGPLSVGLALSLAAAAAHASTVLDLTDTVTYSGTPLAYGFTTTGLANTVVSGPDSLALGDAFNNGTNLSTGTDFNAQATGGGGPWNFQDDYVFTLTGSSLVDVAAISFGTAVGGAYTGLTHLQARLIGAAGNTAAPVVGPPVGGTLVDSWTNFSFNGVNEVTTLPTGFAPGTYILQIRGEAASPASYGGTISFAPVPLPPSLLLLVAGFAAFVVLAARRHGMLD